MPQHMPEFVCAVGRQPNVATQPSLLSLAENSHHRRTSEIAPLIEADQLILGGHAVSPPAGPLRHVDLKDVHAVSPQGPQILSKLGSQSIR